MNTRTLISGIVAGIVIFLVGYGIYGIVMADYFMSAMPSYPGLIKDPMEIWAIGVGNLIWGILLAWSLNAAGITSASRGAVYGAIAFFLYTLGTGFMILGQLNMNTIESIFVEALCNAILMGIAGAVAGWILGRNREMKGER
ncbi:MAG: hypothetical protein WBJ10_03655 [Daejeonella sp.]|uniref:hypothetical protein n=1 Tax=Daejeonella sp. TaxID=2805397 RepID=UPI003C725CF9